MQSLKGIIYRRVFHPLAEVAVRSLGITSWYLEKKGTKFKSIFRMKQRKSSAPLEDTGANKKRSRRYYFQPHTDKKII